MTSRITIRSVPEGVVRYLRARCPNVIPLDFTGRSCSSPAAGAASAAASRRRSSRAGADVVICGRTVPDELPSSGGRDAVFVAADVREPDQVDALVTAVDRPLRPPRRARQQRRRVAAGRHRDRVAALLDRDHHPEPRGAARVRAARVRGDEGPARGRRDPRTSRASAARVRTRAASPTAPRRPASSTSRRRSASSSLPRCAWCA